MSTQFYHAPGAFQQRRHFFSEGYVTIHLATPLAIALQRLFSMRFLSLFHEEPQHECCPLCQY